MRLCNLTYAEALRRHPAEVAQMTTELRASRSKHRLAEPETLTWFYQTCVQYESRSLRSLIEGEIAAKKAPEERAQDQTNRTQTFLCAEIERMCLNARVPNPPEVYLQALAERAALGFA